VAETLEGGCRNTDVVSRYGGEEFCVLLPETTPESAFLWAERMRERISNLTVDVGTTRLNLTASFGVSQRMGDTQSPEHLVDMADQALTVAKRSGRDRVVNFTSLTQATPVSAEQSNPSSILRDIPARQVMTTLVAGLSQDDTIDVASRYFLRFRIAIAPVIDDEGKLVGVLSEKDVMSVMLQPEWWTLLIRNVMKSNVVCYEEDTPALTIYEFLCRVTLRAAVIVNQGRPTGLITRGSLLRYFINALSLGEQREGHEHLPPLGMNEAIDKSQSPEDVRRRIMQIVRAVNDEAADLQERLDQLSDDLVPCLVGGASRIQELANDLLACSQFAGERTLPREQALLLG
jgi:CBS domain-containing protein